MTTTKRATPTLRRGALAALLLTAVLAASDTTQATPAADPLSQRVPAPARPSGASADELHAAVAEHGSVRVIVGTATPTADEADLSVADLSAQRATIEGDVSQVEASLTGTQSRVIEGFESVPAAIAELDSAGVDALLTDPTVESITIDREAPLALDRSTSIIDSTALNNAGVRGDNRTGTRRRFLVAVLDSGVDRGHPALRGRIVSEACFSAVGHCPNGRRTQFGSPAGRVCRYSSQCFHGTHVAGIAAGRGYRGGHRGVAPDAGIVSIQVGHRSTNCAIGEPTPCWRYFFSDLDRALQRVLTLRQGGHKVAAVNLSLGGPLFNRKCGREFPVTQRLASNLRSAGVAVVAASGNNGVVGRVTYPSCLPSVYSVGATTKRDRVAPFSNSSPKLAWWAPGHNIASAIPGGGTGTASGTSMAAPHVAGAFALLRQCPGNLRAEGAAADLSNTGKRIRRGLVTRRRINVLAAARRNVANDPFTRNRVLRNNINNVRGSNSCATRERGEPPIGTPENTIWYAWKPTRTGRAFISTNDKGRNHTTFDTQLTVFRGPRLNALTRLGYDDNGGDGRRSRVVIRVFRGTTYRIRVDGRNAQTGLVNLHTHIG